MAWCCGFGVCLVATGTFVYALASGDKSVTPDAILDAMWDWFVHYDWFTYSVTNETLI